MSGKLKLFGTVSRAEFILPNLGSLILGLAWGANRTLSLASLVTLLILSFMIINLSSAIGAQVNTYSDYELDTKDERKKQLVQAVDSFGKNHIKQAIVIELICALVLVSVFAYELGKPLLFVLWVIGISLGCAYSAPPLRLKARSWLAPASLFLVLAIFPVLFAYYSFTSVIEPLFIASLAGLTLTIYGVIVPTETRDYFGDKAMGIETLTVHLGLAKASFAAIILLAAGAILTTTSFLLKFIYDNHGLLSLPLILVLVVVIYVLGQFRKLHRLSSEYARSGQASVADEITTLSANNPRWIMFVTQTYSFISIILLLSKFLL